MDSVETPLHPTTEAEQIRTREQGKNAGRIVHEGTKANLLGAKSKIETTAGVIFRSESLKLKGEQDRARALAHRKTQEQLKAATAAFHIESPGRRSQERIERPVHAEAA